jgi:hypothetical protein
MQRDLVEQAMAGDRDAFSELARAASGRLYVVARLILRDEGRPDGSERHAILSSPTFVARNIDWGPAAQR